MPYLGDVHFEALLEAAPDAIIVADIDGHRHQDTGLGLHLSRRLRSIVGARITFASEFGRGTTFTVTLNSSPVSRRPSTAQYQRSTP